MSPHKRKQKGSGKQKHNGSSHNGAMPSGDAAQSDISNNNPAQNNSPGPNLRPSTSGEGNKATKKCSTGVDKETKDIFPLTAEVTPSTHDASNYKPGGGSGISNNNPAPLTATKKCSTGVDKETKDVFPLTVEVTPSTHDASNYKPGGGSGISNNNPAPPAPDLKAKRSTSSVRNEATPQSKESTQLTATKKRSTGVDKETKDVFPLTAEDTPSTHDASNYNPGGGSGISNNNPAPPAPDLKAKRSTSSVRNEATPQSKESTQLTATKKRSTGFDKEPKDVFPLKD